MVCLERSLHSFHGSDAISPEIVEPGARMNIEQIMIGYFRRWSVLV